MHPLVPHVSTLPSAHLPALGPGEPPWAALAPRCRGWGGGTCRAVDQQPGHLFYNRGQEAATEPVLRSPLPTPLLATRRGPGNIRQQADGARSSSQGLEPHPGILSSLSPLLTSVSSPICPLICGGGSGGGTGIEWGGLSSSIPRIPGLSCAPRCDERHPWP